MLTSLQAINSTLSRVQLTSHTMCHFSTSFFFVWFQQRKCEAAIDEWTPLLLDRAVSRLPTAVSYFTDSHENVIDLPKALLQECGELFQNMER